MGRPPDCPLLEYALNAAATDQLRLLDLQALDLRRDQLAHRRRTLPEHAGIAALESKASELRDDIVRAETAKSDLDREQRKAESDVEQVRQRATRDRARLDGGLVGSPKELSGLQHEIASLAKRQSDLEDIELDVMERLDAVEHDLSQLLEARSALTVDLDAATARRDAAFGEIDTELASAVDMRTTLSAQIAPPLVTLYEKIREQQGGIGAAALSHRRCQGCRLELNNTELGAARSAPPDEVLRHEDCRRILVRTAESGL